MTSHLTLGDCKSMRKLIDMLWDNWVSSDDIGGASKLTRACAVNDKTNLLLLIEDKERVTKSEQRKARRK